MKIGTPVSPDAMLKQALFEAARHLSTPKERQAYLDRACADDPELRREIEALLELQAPANEFFGNGKSARIANRHSKLGKANGSEEGLSDG